MPDPRQTNIQDLLAAANAARARGDGPAAVNAYRAVLSIDPNHFEACNNLGVIWLLSGHLAEAAGLLEHATAIRPQGVHAWSNLGNALMQSGRVSEALAACRKAVELKPDFFGAACNLAFFMTFDPDCPEERVFEQHRQWAIQHADPLYDPNTQHANDRNPNRRLRIGYVSSDFREHAVAHFMESLLIGHDAREVEVHCFADVPRPDAATARLRGLAHGWQDISRTSDEELAAMIRAMQIDILVDLSGYTHGGRLLAFARKPAPVQVAYLGYPNTTGMKAMDYRIVDGFTDPPGMTESLWIEELIRLPRTFACYHPPANAPGVNALPAQANGFITFGSFAMLSKLNERLIGSWARILSAVEGSRLMMMAGGLQETEIADRIRAAFGSHGIDPARLELVGQQNFGGYLLGHHRIDLLLDSFPVNGHTVSCHALWMGIPFVSLAGKSYRSRLGASVLNNMGLTEVLAESVEEYERKAIELARETGRLSSLRSSLRQRMRSSPICDTRTFARDVEAAFRAMWRTWCGK